jgi:hypothetical protein
VEPPHELGRHAPFLFIDLDLPFFSFFLPGFEPIHWLVRQGRGQALDADGDTGWVKTLMVFGSVPMNKDWNNFDPDFPSYTSILPKNESVLLQPAISLDSLSFPRSIDWLFLSVRISFAKSLIHHLVNLETTKRTSTYYFD